MLVLHLVNCWVGNCHLAFHWAQNYWLANCSAPQKAPDWSWELHSVQNLS